MYATVVALLVAAVRRLTTNIMVGCLVTLAVSFHHSGDAGKNSSLLERCR